MTWKHGLLACRDRRSLLRELLVPTLLLAVLVLMRLGIPSGETPAKSDYSATLIADPVYLYTSSSQSVLVAPCKALNVSSDALADRFAYYLYYRVRTSVASEPVRCFSTEKEMLRWARDHYSDVAGAVVVDEPLGLNMSSSKAFEYRIRMDAASDLSGTGPNIPVFVPSWKKPPNDAASAWADGNYLTMQVMVEWAAGRTRYTTRPVGSSAIDPSNSWYAYSSAVIMPTFAYTDQTAATALSNILPIYLVLVFSVQLRVILQAILEEKEKGAREALSVSGLSDAAYWAGWTGFAGLKIAAMVTVVTIVSAIGQLFGKTDPIILLVSFLLFALTTGPFILLVASFFQTARSGGAVGMLIFFATSLPGYLLVLPGVAPSARVGASVMAPTAFFLTTSLLNRAEIEGNPISWSNLGDPGVSSMGVSLQTMWTMLLIDFACYGAIAWYVDKVVPNKHGRALPWYFLCHPRWLAASCGLGTADADRPAGGSPSSAALAPASPLVTSRHEQEEEEAAAVKARSGRARRGAAGGAASSGAPLPERTPSGTLGEVALASGSGGAVTVGDGLSDVVPDDESSLFREPAIEPVDDEVRSRPGVRIRGLTRVFPRGRDPSAAAQAAVERRGGGGARGSSASGGDDMWTLRGCCRRLQTWMRRMGPPQGQTLPGQGRPVDHVVARARGDVVALERLHLDMYEGQVLALLGPNGCGKSTTVGLLTGTTPADEGDAWLYGRSVTWNRSGARALVGVCPQHDVSFGKLTVREHVLLFAGVQGLVGPEAEEAVRRVLGEVGLTDKADTMETTLSGGQKRRLAVASALVGDPKVLFLDEPTSGCDAAARRQIWSVIERRKRGRVIVLTTHMMPEAEVLGDRVAILANGRLRVCGRPLYLKSRFGIGYHLSVGGSAGCVPSRILAAVRAHVPSAALQRVSGGAADEGLSLERGDRVGGTGGDSELLLTLPVHAAPKFPDLLDDLEAKRDTLDITGYGISVSTLEEVFLRLVEAVEEEEAAEEAELLGGTASSAASSIHSAATLPSAAAPCEVSDDDDDAGDVEMAARARGAAGASASATKPPPSSTPSAPSGISLLGDLPDSFLEPTSLWAQVQVMVWRRLLRLRRNARAVALQLFVPLVFVAVSVSFQQLRNIPTGSATGAVDLSAAAALFPGQEAQANRHRPLAAPWSYVNDYASPKATVTGAMTEAPSGGWPGPAPAHKGVPAPRALAGPVTKTNFSEALLGPAGDEAPVAMLASLSFDNHPWSWTLDVLYNTSYTNGLPAAISLLHSGLVSAAEGNWTARSGPLFEGKSDPFPVSVSQDAAELNVALVGQYSGSMVQGLYATLGFSIMTGLIAQVVVQERESKSKHLQIVSGAHPAAYWIAAWVAEAVGFLPLSVGATIVLGVLSPLAGAALSAAQLAATWMLIVAFGAALPGLVFTMSFLFTQAATAQTWMSTIQYWSMMLLFGISFGLEMPSVNSPIPVRLAVRYFGSLIPGYALCKGLGDVFFSTVCNGATATPEHPCAPTSPFAWDVAPQKIVVLLLSIPVWFFLLLQVERRSAPAAPSTTPFAGSAYAGTAVSVAASGHPAAAAAAAASAAGGRGEDPDVTAERERVAALAPRAGAASSGQVPVWCENMGKSFEIPAQRGSPGGWLRAVDRLSLVVGRGEVLGLLGHNGAGKTTALRMLTVELAPSRGRIRLAGHEVPARREEALKHMGYCPQQDAVFPELTGREVLTFFARLRGVRADHVAELVKSTLGVLALGKFADQPTKSYSGGNRRKLSTAVAYIGRPDVVLLDESSTGVDPGARRKLWELVWARQGRRATVLTTHNLDEAARLCSRVGIMVNGKLACLGTPSHLRSRFSRGYQVELSTREPASLRLVLADVLSALVAAFDLRGRTEDGYPVGTIDGAPAWGPPLPDPLVPDPPESAADGRLVRVIEAHGRHARVEFPHARSKHLSLLFRTLETAKSTRNLQDYSCTEATLEQVFLTLTRHQRDEPDPSATQPASTAHLDRLLRRLALLA